MPDSSLAWLSQADNARFLRSGLRGLERETLRVDREGRLSRRPHPAAIGSALTHPYLTTDYSEALLEFVTPPFASNAETIGFLSALHAHVYEHLDGELLWPASMPCILQADENIPIAEYGPSNEGRLRTVYRRGLGARYGRAMQAIAGTHFNYSPPAEIWPLLEDMHGAAAEHRSFKSDALMGLVRNYRRHAWLIVYLFGSSPALCKSFMPAGHRRLEDLDGHTWYAPHGTSLRMSDLGYRNSTQSRLRISANSIDEYVAELKAAVTTADPRYESIGVRDADGEYRQLNSNVLQIENEYYSSVRPKGANRSLRPLTALERHGVEYVEIRTLDLDAEDPVGIDDRRLRVLETLALYCLIAESPPMSRAEQDEIDDRELKVAWEGRRPGLKIAAGGREVELRDAGLAILSRLEPVAEALDSQGIDYGQALTAAREALRDPERTPSARLLDALRAEKSGFFEYGRALAERHRRYFASHPLRASLRDELTNLAARSRADAAALEAAPQPPFETYLQQYLAS